MTKHFLLRLSKFTRKISQMLQIIDLLEIFSKKNPSYHSSEMLGYSKSKNYKFLVQKKIISIAKKVNFSS